MGHGAYRHEDQFGKGRHHQAYKISNLAARREKCGYGGELVHGMQRNGSFCILK